MNDTVFIVGAGASTEFNGTATMPVGSELAVRIEDLLDDELRRLRRREPGPISSCILRSPGGMINQHELAMQRIRDGIQSRSSVDEFIDEWQDVPKLTEVAKLCIAHLMLKAEEGSVLGDIAFGRGATAPTLRKVRDSWLGIISRNLNPKARRRDVIDVFKDCAFITFNYDRSIEQFLMSTFVSTHGLSHAEASEALATIPIHHVYGSLGDLEPGKWGTSVGLRTTFGSDCNRLDLAAAQIRTFTEELASGDIAKLRECISDASRLVFLGCAYHPQNLQALFPEGPFTVSKHVWGTTYQMRPRAVDRVRSYFDDDGVTLEALTCSQLLTEFQEDIFQL